MSLSQRQRSHSSSAPAALDRALRLRLLLLLGTSSASFLLSLGCADFPSPSAEKAEYNQVDQGPSPGSFIPAAAILPVRFPVCFPITQSALNCIIEGCAAYLHSG